MQYPPVKNHSDRYFKTCIMCMWETMGNLQIYVVPGSTGTKSSVWKCGKFHGENPRKIMKKVGKSKSSEFLPWHHATSWCQPLLHTHTYTSKCTYLKLTLLQSPGGNFSRCYCYTFDNIAWSYPCDTLIEHGRTIPSTVFVFPRYRYHPMTHQGSDHSHLPWRHHAWIFESWFVDRRIRRPSILDDQRPRVNIGL